ncbi:MAG: GGDEF domain-containing protein [Nitrospirae bacterium]|nr:GGDEF domain-containing protein [Nitrospirota bacterium]
MIDIDNLKDINDSHGHLTGDRILVEAVALIKNAVRKSDIVIRYGGDEFLIFMNDGGCDETAVMIDRISELVDVWNRDKAAIFGCRLSLSMGCATCDKDCDVYDALKIADERMYQDKREKKN